MTCFPEYVAPATVLLPESFRGGCSFGAGAQRLTSIYVPALGSELSHGGEAAYYMVIKAVRQASRSLVAQGTLIRQLLGC